MVEEEEKFVPEEESKEEEKEKIEKEISLRDLLIYENPKADEYKKIILNEHKFHEGAGPFNSFSEFWEEIYHDKSIGVAITRGEYKGEEEARYDPPRFEKVRTYFKNKLQDEILIDLGCWNNTYMLDLAKKSGVSRYIGVDIWYEDSLDPYIGEFFCSDYNYERLPEKERTHPMENIAVNADMLDFVSKLPTNSCNFVLNGIDHYVLKNEDYKEALFNEVARATKVGGIMFGIETEIWKDDSRFKTVAEELGLERRNRAIFEKVQENKES